MRDILMAPSNRFRIKEALLGLLAGDVFRGMPFRWRLLLFKLVYYLRNAARPRRAWQAWLKRRQVIQAT